MPKKLSKRMASAVEGIDKTKQYSIAEALSFLKKSTSLLKFDPSIEVSIKIGIDLKKLNTGIRGMVSLPAGTGKKTIVAVICKTDEKIKESNDSGADLVGSKEIIEEIKSGNINFDACIATPDMMASIGSVARILGPRGLMPNPKLGTVTFDIEKTVKKFKSGMLEFKMDKFGFINMKAGKASFSDIDIEKNVNSIIESIAGVEPSNAKEKYFEQGMISYTMGPSLMLRNEIFSVKTGK